MTAWTLVTGSSRGLGAELCRVLAAQGHHLVIQYRSSQSRAEEVAAACQKHGVQACCLQGDFSSSASVQDFLVRYQRQCSQTRYLVNNASEYALGTVSETDTANWLRLFQVNFHAPVAITRALKNSLLATNGALVNVGVAGVQRLHADVHASAYFASKAALWTVTRSLARELATARVQCNMVSPGYLESSIDHPSAPKNLPMQRLGSLKEVARAIAFLLHADSSYITGQNIEVAGGVRI